MMDERGAPSMGLYRKRTFKIQARPVNPTLQVQMCQPPISLEPAVNRLFVGRLGLGFLVFEQNIGLTGNKGPRVREHELRYLK